MLNTGAGGSLADLSCSTVFYGNSSDLASPDVVSASVTDNSGSTASAMVYIAVKPALTLSIGPSANTVYVGGSVSISNSTTGGFPIYNYYYIIPAGVVENGNSFSFTSPGVYDITEEVTDMNGASAFSSIYITVLPIISTSVFVPDTTIVAGQSAPISVLTSGGTPPYSYEWFVNGVQNTSSTSNTFLFSPVTPSTYTIYVVVSDLNGYTDQSSNIIITVVAPLSTVLYPKSSVISTGQTVVFTNSTAGGAPPYTYSYTANNVAGVTQEGNALTFNNISSYLVTLTVNDMIGETATSQALVMVTPPLEFTSFTANRTDISTDQAVRFTNATSGGTGHNIFAYNVVGEGCSVDSTVGNVITLNNAGSSTITCIVTENVVDTSGEVNQTNAVAITVTPALRFTSFTANTNLISVGQVVGFTNTTSGGTGHNIYSYTVNAPQSGCMSHKVYSITGNSILFSAAGSYLVTLHVSDISGETNQSTQTITVTPPLEIAAFTANTNLISTNQVVSFTNRTTGGTGHNVYSYTVSAASGYTVTGNSILFSAAGSYPVTLHVSDISGETNQSTQVITVTPPWGKGCTGSNKGGIIMITGSYIHKIIQITNQSAVQVTGSSDNITINMPGSNCNIAVQVTGSSNKLNIYNGTITMTETGSYNIATLQNTILSTQTTITGSMNKISGAIINGNTFTITGSTSVFESMQIENLTSLQLTGSGVTITMDVLSAKPMAVSITGSYDTVYITNGTISLRITGILDNFYYHGTTITSQSITGSSDKIIKD
jgi:hypothetical protein